MNALEITHLHTNIQKNVLGKWLIIGFAQVAKSPKVRQHFERGKELATKHLKIFTDVLLSDDLPAPTLSDTCVTDSTTQTFSDKLMLFHINATTAESIGDYGIAIGASPRRDLTLAYGRLFSEIALYADDGVEMMIEHGWFEQPPMADNRKSLARK
ncbi:DUF3231 family protein [Alicyclobacillus fastidiosus]|uniref:DUF3231 family protein n=1 Tax=Alicyclobacillus fastidiosus TaxID=392011 RepID=A0ABY6ZN03_9BACL|nr:DUF3231 family protein [Alicyclobacillus fastidiosus]WAH43340.1 DUF3231 family protein [Alicyclobacillus fastidiosus]GMA65399.1 hypothetical protein GCM10025859_58390 [Alicyclobacillus fastidiosus]